MKSQAFQRTTPSTAPAYPIGTQLTGSGALPPAGINVDQLLVILHRRQRIVLSVVAIVLGATVGATIWERLVRPSFAGSFQLLVAQPLSRGTNNENKAAILADLEPDTNVPNLIEVLASPMLLAPLEKTLDVPAESLLRNILISQPVEEADNVIKVQLNWGDSKEGSRVLDAVSQHYLAYSLKQRQEKLRQGLSFLDEQAPILQKRVSSLQEELATFRLKYNLLDPAIKAKELQTTQEDVVKQLRAVRVKEAELMGLEHSVLQGNLSTSLLAELPAMSSAVAINGATTGSSQITFGVDKLSNGPVPSLLSELIRVEKELAVASASFRGSAPNVSSLEAQRNRLRPLLQRHQLEAIRAALVENRSSQRELSDQLAIATAGFRNNPALQKEFDDIEQRLEVARENLEAYIKSREAFRLEIAQDTVPWQLISPPSFGDQPIKPNLGRNLMLGSLLALLAGSGAALLRDRFDKVFHTSSEVVEHIPLPLLGAIPNLSLIKGLKISHSLARLSNEESYVLRESLNNLIANFRLLRADRPVRVVAVTSTQEAEGKSTVTALLARKFAEMGQRVLLIDADMRAPSIHTLMGIDNQRGLSNLLTEADQPIETLLQHPSPNLAVLAAGPQPPDPAKLLASEHASRFLKEVRRFAGTDYDDYALVIFDTPESLTLSDAMVLSKLLDGIFFLVSLGEVNRDLPSQALQRFETSGVDVLGLITNQVSSRFSAANTIAAASAKPAWSMAEAPSHHIPKDSPSRRLPAPKRPGFQKKFTATKAIRERSEQLLRWFDNRST